MECPIWLDKVHCDNCSFWREGKCDYEGIMAGWDRDKVGELMVAVEELMVGVKGLNEAGLRLVLRFAEFLAKEKGG